jgi:hypothetical protein
MHWVGRKPFTGTGLTGSVEGRASYWRRESASERLSRRRRWQVPEAGRRVPEDDRHHRRVEHCSYELLRRERQQLGRDGS